MSGIKKIHAAILHTNGNIKNQQQTIISDLKLNKNKYNNGNDISWKSKKKWNNKTRNKHEYIHKLRMSVWLNHTIVFYIISYFGWTDTSLVTSQWCAEYLFIRHNACTIKIINKEDWRTVTQKWKFKRYIIFNQCDFAYVSSYVSQKMA